MPKIRCHHLLGRGKRDGLAARISGSAPCSGINSTGLNMRVLRLCSPVSEAIEGQLFFQNCYTRRIKNKLLAEQLGDFIVRHAEKDAWNNLFVALHCMRVSSIVQVIAVKL